MKFRWGDIVEVNDNTKTDRWSLAIYLGRKYDYHVCIPMYRSKPFYFEHCRPSKIKPERKDILSDDYDELLRWGDHVVVRDFSIEKWQPAIFLGITPDVQNICITHDSVKESRWNYCKHLSNNRS